MRFWGGRNVAAARWDPQGRQGALWPRGRLLPRSIAAVILFEHSLLSALAALPSSGRPLGCHLPKVGASSELPSFRLGVHICEVAPPAALGSP